MGDERWAMGDGRWAIKDSFQRFLFGLSVAFAGASWLGWRRDGVSGYYFPPICDYYQLLFLCFMLAVTHSSMNDTLPSSCLQP
jgi:hypothetical protein